MNIPSGLYKFIIFCEQFNEKFRIPAATRALELHMRCISKQHAHLGRRIFRSELCDGIGIHFERVQPNHTV